MSIKDGIIAKQSALVQLVQHLLGGVTAPKVLAQNIQLEASTPLLDSAFVFDQMLKCRAAL